MNPPYSHARVLIAEGDSDLRRELFRVLLERDIFSDTAADGVQALDCLASCDYTILLLDLTLPRIDAQQMLAHLAALAPERRPMVLVIAGAELPQALDADLVQVILRRPLRTRDIAELVENCLRVVVRRPPTHPGRIQVPQVRSDDDDHPC